MEFHTSTASPPARSVRHAVILAAGKSQRFRENGTKKPKVLLKVGGLRLLERTILTLHAAGIEHFRVVVGAYREQVTEELKRSPRLQGLQVEFVECPDYELGNGVSFAAGAAGLQDPFLLTMSDHIFSASTIEAFLEDVARHPQLPALACDPKLEEVFDMDDATKVASRKGFIHRIGKQLTDFDLVDTGLFYFPEGYGDKVRRQKEKGACSVSEIVQEFIEETGVRAVALPEAFWQDVDNPSMKKEAERRLLQSLGTPADGWVSRKINRHFSRPLSLLMARWGWAPNAITTGVFLLSLVGVWLAASAQEWRIALGALIFQIASILDGCDGEVARLTLRSSRLGAWYDRLAGNVRYFLFFEALGVSAYRSTGSEVYLVALILLAAVALYMVAQMGLFAYKQQGTVKDLEPAPRPSDSLGPVDRFFNLWREWNKRDVLAFSALLLCGVFFYEIMFWLALVGVVFTALSVSQRITFFKRPKADLSFFQRIDPVIFYLLGITILCILIYNMDLNVVGESLRAVGNKVFLVFATAVLWIICNVLCIYTILQGRVSFFDLLYNQLTGDAYNTIIPLAGLGGEPYKIKHLTNWLDVHTASRSIVQDRLIHSLTGILFTSITVWIMLAFVQVEDRIFIPLVVLSIVLAFISFGMMWLTVSPAPSKISGYFLKRLKILDTFREERLPLSRFALAFTFKMMGRFLNLVELYVIFRILGFEPGLVELVTVAAMIALSATLFFVVPQGLGVNEAGISGALTLLGYPAPLGLTFGLIRRARMIFWALFGVALHLGSLLFRRLYPSKVLAEK